MSITLTLPPDLEARLHTHLATRDASGLRAVLTEAIEPMVQALLEPEPVPDLPVFDRFLDEFLTEATRLRGPDAPPLSDYAVSREGIYEDHP